MPSVPVVSQSTLPHAQVDGLASEPSVVGVAVAAITIAAFLRTIGFGLEWRGVPFLLPTVTELAGFAGVSVAAVSLTAVVGATSAAWVAARRRPWLLLRGDPT